MATEKDNSGLKVTAIVCLTVLGVVNLIGLFWGADGLVRTSQVIFTLIALSIFLIEIRD